MITVDASAILAILLQEEDAARLTVALADAGGAVMSPVNHWEVLVRAYRARGEPGRQAAEDLLAAFEVVVTPTSAAASRDAADAFIRFGAGKAGLNLGDCFAYALASSQGDGLLFKGDDFPRTDIPAVV